MNRDNSFGPGHLVALYIDTVPNRNSPPAILLHEGWREGGKVKKRTLANLSKWPQEKIESLRRLLKNEPLVRREEAFDIERSLPVHSFPTLLADLATIAKNRVIPRLSGAEPFTVVIRPAALLRCWPSRLVFYAHYTGELSRNRFLAILLLPTLVISGAPLLLAIIVQSSSGWLALVSIFNAAAACGDLFGAGVVLAQIPSTAKVRDQGWTTYWKKAIFPCGHVGLDLARSVAGNRDAGVPGGIGAVALLHDSRVDQVGAAVTIGSLGPL